MALSLGISSAMRAVGETKIPLVISAGAVLINTFLNYCLIFGNFGFPRLGVEGAAIATLIARLVEAAVAAAGTGEAAVCLQVEALTDVSCFRAAGSQHFDQSGSAGAE